MKNHKSETKLHLPKLGFMVGIAIMIVIVITNIVSFFTIDADQFNLFYKYKNVYRLETWNIPSNVDVDINGDGIEDRMSWNGCLFLSGTSDKDIVSKQYDCHDKQPKGIRVFNIGKPVLPEIRLSYVGRTNSDNLDIVLIRNLHTEVFNITDKGEVVQRKVAISLKADTALYFITHLFVLFFYYL
jgi:hypothetical protein